MPAGDLEYFGAAILGDRSTQQDAFAVARWCDDGARTGLAICLADGMGGHRGGAEASRLAVTTALDAFLASNGQLESRLRESAMAANAAIARAKERLGLEDGDKMGCTVVLAAVRDNRCCWISVGDSILLLVRDGAARRLNRDHSMAPVLDQMAEAGEITAEDARTDSRRNMLRSALHGTTVALMDINTDGIELGEGDLLCLASDGILALGPAEVSALLVDNDTNVERKVSELLRAVSERGTRPLDNTTVVMCSRPARGLRGILGRALRSLP